MKKNLVYSFILVIIEIFPYIFGIFIIPNIQMKPYISELEEIKPSYPFQLNIGAWIIIGGDRSDHHLIDLMKSGCDIAHFVLRNRGFAEDDIYNLGPDYGPPGLFQEDDATHANIEYAITTWAAGKVDSSKALGIYLLDHGGTNYMCIPGSPDLSDSDLNNWLNELETSTGCNRVVIIYDACRAGTFINPVSKDNRIVIASTDTTHSAYGTSDLSWAWFSEGFFSSIIACKTIGECFEDAVAHVKAVESPQYPLIDDNHDETGNEVGILGTLPNGGDGSDALNWWIGSGSNCPETYIHWFPLTAYIGINELIIPIWAVVSNSSEIEKIYVRIVPPGHIPPEPEPDNEGFKIMRDPGIFVQYLNDPDGDGNFTAKIYPQRNPNFWGTKGDYKATFHARCNDGSAAAIETSYIVLNDDGIPPEDTIDPTVVILTPEDDDIVDDDVKIKVTGDDDQALDKIQIFFDDELVKEEEMPDYYPYPEVIYELDTEDYEDGTYDITAKAIDKNKNEKTETISIEIQNESGQGLRIPGYHVSVIIITLFVGLAIVLNLKKEIKSNLKFSK